MLTSFTINEVVTNGNTKFVPITSTFVGIATDESNKIISVSLATTSLNLIVDDNVVKILPDDHYLIVESIENSAFSSVIADVDNITLKPSQNNSKVILGGKLNNIQIDNYQNTGIAVSSNNKIKFINPVGELPIYHGVNVVNDISAEINILYGETRTINIGNIDTSTIKCNIQVRSDNGVTESFTYMAVNGNGITVGQDFNRVCTGISSLVSIGCTGSFQLEFTNIDPSEANINVICKSTELNANPIQFISAPAPA